MEKIHNAHQYDFYFENVDGKAWCNIIPEGQPAPNGGHAFEWIAHVKNIPKDIQAEVIGKITLLMSADK